MSDDKPATRRRARPKPEASPTTRSEVDGGGKARKDRGPGKVDATAAVPPEHRSDLIRVPLSVRWRDLDAFNHVNNSKFLSYLEEARLRWMMTLPGEWIDENVAPVVAAAHVNYRRPIAWPSEIIIELFVERLGNTSLTIGHRIVDATDADALYADGNVVMVWIDKQNGQPAALPATVRASCKAA